MSRTRIFALVCVLAPALWAGDMVLVPAGSFVPFFARPNQAGSLSADAVQVPAFRIDAYPVTKGEFLTFVKAHPEWRRSGVPRIFADQQYLADWSGDLELAGPETESQRPATQVSWFAARSFCQSQGKELPTTDQWEYVAYDRGRSRSGILNWIEQPNTALLPPVHSLPANGFGVSGLYGPIWEWTLDFNQAGAASGDTDDAFCGNGSVGVTDPADYAAFLRYAFRNSLKANYTMGKLGFRCVREIRR